MSSRRQNLGEVSQENPEKEMPSFSERQAPKPHTCHLHPDITADMEAEPAGGEERHKGGREEGKGRSVGKYISNI